MTAKRIKLKPPIRWALRWSYDWGEEFMWNDSQPLLFMTRREARAYARFKYGYIVTRKDLRSPPHNWRMPVPVRVEVVLREVREAK